MWGIILGLGLVLAGIYGMTHNMREPRVNFVGPLDKDCCDCCRKAVKGSPWPVTKAPIPGTLGCGKRCRHALQIHDDDIEVYAQNEKKWKRYIDTKKKRKERTC